MTIPDEAVQAAEAEFTAYFVKNYPGPDTIIFKPEWHAPKIFRAALHSIRASMPFLQGVKVDPWGWVIPRGGDKKPIILEASKFDQASAAAEADIHDLGYFPIYTQPAPSPSPRAQALEEAAKIADKGNAGWLKKRDVTANKKEARDYETMAIACSHVAAAIRALSSQPVADGVITKTLNGYVTERDAEVIKGGALWAVLVHCKQSDIYSVPVTVTLPTSPGANKVVRSQSHHVNSGAFRRLTQSEWKELGGDSNPLCDWHEGIGYVIYDDQAHQDYLARTGAVSSTQSSEGAE